MKKEGKTGAFGKVKIVIATAVFLVAGLFELYVMINQPAKYMELGLLAIIMLIALYFVIVSAISIVQDREEEKAEKYENLIKSEKASYLLMRKYFTELEEKIEHLTNSSRDSSIELLNAQKNIAKIMMSRTKEDADALMNSNDLIVEKINRLEELQNKNDVQLAAVRTECIEEIHKMELSVKDSLLHINPTVTVAQPQIIAAPLENTPETVEKVTEIAPEPEEEVVAEIVSEPEAEAIEELASEPEAEVIEELASEPEAETEEVVPVEEPTITPVSDDPNHVMTPEEITALVAGASEPAEAEPKELEISDPEPAEEPTITPVSDDPNHVMTPEEIAALVAGASEPAKAEPAELEVSGSEPVEEPTITPVSDDPNHVMTPEEIAALVAGASEPAAAENVEPEVVEEDDTDEEMPPMPDLSDPNHVMTPDEIAALLANM